MTYLASLHEEILSREQDAYRILFVDQGYNDEQVRPLCKQVDGIILNQKKTELLSVTLRTTEFSDFVKRNFNEIPFDDGPVKNFV